MNIFWSDSDGEIPASQTLSSANDVQIFIAPAQCDLFRVRIVAKDGFSVFGPLRDGMIVRKTMLGCLVRLTAVNATKSCLSKKEGYKAAHALRREFLRETVSRFRLDGLGMTAWLQKIFVV